ncbi:MAG TPA: IgGFc-binding protein, partial [Tenuifilaceae bacterium]|nr:IgGFc-binding protein [Tenuifilaceae bacterium]
MYKKRLFVKILFCGFLLLYGLRLTAQTDTEFWFSVPEINRYHWSGTDASPGNRGYPVYLRLTNSSDNLDSEVTITMPANASNFNGGNPYTFTIPARTTQTLDLANLNFIGDDRPGVTSLTSIENRLRWTESNTSGSWYINRNNKGVKISATTPITVYYEISAIYNMELLALKGKNALGKSFFVPFQNTYPVTGNYNYRYRPYSSFVIVATEDNTQIRINPTQNIFVFPSDQLPANTPFTIWLSKGQTSIIAPYQYHEYPAGTASIHRTHNSNKLSGTSVDVLSGGNIAIITCDDMVTQGGGVDFVGDQIVPTTLIGTEYAVIRGALADNKEHVYVVGTENATRIWVNGVESLPAINSRGTRPIPIPSGQIITRIETDKPAYVYHLSGFDNGAQNQTAGAIIPTISVCTGSTKVSFNRTKANYDNGYGNKYYDFYMNILVRKGAENSFVLYDKNGNDVTNVVLPGLNLPGSYTDVGATAPFDEWMYARFLANNVLSGIDEAYSLVNTDDVFHLGILNGNAGADAFYGYFSDFDVFNPSTFIVETGAPGGIICAGESLQLYASGGNRYEWSPSDFLDGNIYDDTPMASNITYSVPYKVHIWGGCGNDTIQKVDVIVGGPVFPSFDTDKFAACASKVNPADPAEIPKATFTFTNTSQFDYYRNWYYKVGETGTPIPIASGEGGPNYPDPGWDDPSTPGWDDPTYGNVISFDFPNNTNDTLRYYIILETADEGGLCTPSATQSIMVFPYFNIAPTALVTDNCEPVSVDFKTNPSGNYTAGTYYNWEFGVVGSSTSPDITKVLENPGTIGITIPVSLTVTDEWGFCSVSWNTDIDVPARLRASYTIDENEGCSPLSVVLTNDSKGAETWNWFVDGTLRGTSSTPPNINSYLTNTRTDNNEEIHNLNLVVTNNAGQCSKNFSRDIHVFPIPNATRVITPLGDTRCSPLDVDYEATNIVNTDAYQWRVDGTPVSTVASGTLTLENYGAASISKQVSYTATNNWGCSFNPAPTNITVQPYVEAIISLDVEEGCSPLDVTFTNASSAGSSVIQWNVDGVNVANPNSLLDFENPTVTNTVRTIPVTLTAQNSAGCTDVDSRNIRVNPRATANFTFDFEDDEG